MERIKIIGNGLLGLMFIGLLAGCSTSGPKHERPPENLAKLPDAVPQGEPPSRYGNPPSYVVFGKRYYVSGTSEGYRERGVASWYGADFHGKRTSSGPPFDMYAITAAHKSLPIPTYVRVTHLGNGRRIVVKVNDRGPFVDDRIIDLSYAAAAKLDMIESGTAEVEVTALPPYQYLPDFAPADPHRTLAVNTAGDSPASPAFVQTSYQTPAVNNAVYRPASERTFSPVGEAGDSFYLQVGAFSDHRNAERLRSRLLSRINHDIRIDRDRDRLHKVRVGPLNTTAEAERLIPQLTALGVVTPHVIFD